MYLRSITMSFHWTASTSIRSLSLSKGPNWIDYSVYIGGFDRLSHRYRFTDYSGFALMKLLTLGIINVNIASALAYSQLSPPHHITKSVFLGLYTQKKESHVCGTLLRCGRDLNPRPPAWQADILTNWTTAPLLFVSVYLSIAMQR